MATGHPLIVTDVGGNAEAVQNGYNGIVIPPFDAEALSEAIVEMYRYPQKRKKMGICSRKRAEQEFSLQRMVTNYEKYYEYLMV